MEPKRLAQYVRLCRKLGVNKLSLGDISFEVDLAFEPTSKVGNTISKVGSTDSKLPDSLQVEELSNEDLLFWSAGRQLDTNG